MHINYECDISDAQIGIDIKFCDTTHLSNCNIWKNNVDKKHVIQDLQYGLTWISLQQAFSVLGVGHFDSCHLYLPVPSGRIKGLCVVYRSRVHGIGIMWSIYMRGLYMASLNSAATLLI